MSLSIVQGDMHVAGNLSADSMTLADGAVDNAAIDDNAGIVRSKLQLESLKVVEIPLSAWKIHDSLQQLPATSSGDDLGWYPGTFGTDAPLIRSGDLKAAGATTLRARAQITLPLNYESANDVQIRAFAGMVTTVSDGTATIDFECYKVTGAGVGSDLVTTAATSINSTTFANKDFVVTQAGLVAGDTLDIRMTVAVNDGATATAVIAAIAKTQLLIDVRG